MCAELANTQAATGPSTLRGRSLFTSKLHCTLEQCHKREERMAEMKETRRIERERDCVSKNYTDMVTNMIEKGVHATLTSIGKEVVNPFYSQQLSLPGGKEPKSKHTVFTPAVAPFSSADQRDEQVLTPSLIAHTMRFSTTTNICIHIYIYIYIYIYIFMYIYMYIYLYIYIHIYVYIFPFLSLSLSLYI